MLREIVSGVTVDDRGRSGSCATQKLLLVFMTLGILAAGAVIVSFAVMCRSHLHNIPGDGGANSHQHLDQEGEICKAIYRPGDESVAFAEVLRLLIAFIAVASMFTVCGICCCYHLSVARDQTERLKAVLGHYNIPEDLDSSIQEDFKQYLSIALKAELSNNTEMEDCQKTPLPDYDEEDKDVQVSLIVHNKDMENNSDVNGNSLHEHVTSSDVQVRVMAEETEIVSPSCAVSMVTNDNQEQQ